MNCLTALHLQQYQLYSQCTRIYHIYVNIHIWFICIHVSKLCKSIRNTLIYLSTHSIPNKKQLWLVGGVQCCNHGIRFLVCILIYIYIYIIYITKYNINMQATSHFLSNVHPPKFISQCLLMKFSLQITIFWAQNLQTHLLCSFRTFPTPLHHFFQFLLSKQNPKKSRWM